MIEYYKKIFKRTELKNKCNHINSLLGDLSSHSLDYGGKIAGYVLEIRIILDKIEKEIVEN